MTDVKQQENTVTAVSLQGVSHTYGQVRALNNIHLSIPKSVTVGLIGPDGVGKSTLINKMVAEKVAIVSDKAGTTRDNIKGILNFGDNQYIFIDTPGIHKPKHLLGEHMTNSAIRVLKDVDVIVFMLDGSQEISTGDQFVMEKVSEEKKTPKILVINKIDKLNIKVSHVEFLETPKSKSTFYA